MSQDIDRMSVTLPPSLLNDLDDVVDAGEYDSRSEATRDALQAFVTETDRPTSPGVLAEQWSSCMNTSTAA